MWSRHRRVMTASFKQTRFSNLIMSTFQSLAEALTTHIQEGETRQVTTDLQDWIEKAVFQVMGMFAYNHNYNTINRPRTRYFDEYRNVLKALFTPSILMHVLKIDPERLKYFPSLDGYFYSMHVTRDFIRDHLQDIINQRRKEIAAMTEEERAKQEDMLAHILIANDKDYTDADIRADLFSLFFAGHETTANTITFCLYHLARYPVYQLLAREEAQNFIEAWDGSTEIRPEDLRNAMPNLYALLLETFRLYPAATAGLNRDAIAADLNIGGFEIPIKSNVLPNIQGPQRRVQTWGEDAEEFRPERFFNDGNSDSGFNKEAVNNLLVFGYGPRSCLGKRIATVEIMMGLAVLLTKFRFALPEDSPHRERIQMMPVLAVLAANDLQFEVTLI